MKKIMAFAAAASVAISAAAEGYQVNSLSARQNGMGHTGTALKLGVESMFFNPAGMAFMDNQMEIMGSFTAIMPTAKATLPDGSVYETDNNASTPISAGMAFSVYDNLKVGIDFYTPYGSGINWTENWPGAVLNQSVTLKAFTLQPTVSWRILPNLSVGAGLMVTWGNVDLNKGLITPSSLDMLLQQMGQQAVFGKITPASVNLNGTSKVALGVNVGAMYDINSQWTVGASLRTKMNMKVDAGKAALTYANELAANLLQETIGVINQANFKAQMPCPWVFNFGVSYKPVDKLTLAADAQLTGWHAYKSLDVEFLELPTAFNQYIPKKYSNSWTWHLGAQYAVTDRFDARVGLMVDTSPCNEDYYNPETPGMTKIEPAVGVSFRPVKGLSIDASFLYVAGLGKDNASCTYDDMLLTSLGVPEYTRTFTADYKVHALAPAIGVSYSF